MEDNAYQSSEIYLSMIQAEYQSEKERATALDSKIAFSIPVISAYFFLLAQDANVRELWRFVAGFEYSVEMLRKISPLFLYFIAVFTALSSLLWMIHATWTHNSGEVSIRKSYPLKSLSMRKDEFYTKVAQYYLIQFEWCRTANGTTSREYRLGWTWGICSLICFLLYTFSTWG